MRRYASALLLVLVAAGCAATGEPPSFPGASRVAPMQLRVRQAGPGGASIVQVALEQYVLGSIVSEFAPAGGDAAVVRRMLEVQAVLSRTYAISHLGRHRRDGYDLCDTTHCQLYEPARLRTSRWAPVAAEAVRKTAGTVLSFDHGAALALFHADCGGHTSSPAAVWGGAPHPYLRATADDGPAAAAHATWRYAAADEAVRVALNTDPRTMVGRRLRAIAIVERDEAGRAARVRITGDHVREVRGEAFRAILSSAFGARAIRSTWFDVRRERARWVFEGRGFGHGVGLCQAGALARLGAGAAPSAVLARYFPGTTLTRLR
jgi:stage II sporulation protein D